MTTERFVKQLADAGFDVHRDSILDALWLGSLGLELSMPPTAPLGREMKAEPPPAPPVNPVDDERTQDEGGTEPRNDPDPGVTEDDPSNERGPAVYNYGEVAGEDVTIRATAIHLPSARALGDRLPLIRGLRPFRRRFPSSHALELDEERTAELTAEMYLQGGGFIVPVLRPRYERWYDVHVVIEDDPAIEMWAAPLREYVQLLRDSGAFRLVRTWRLRLGPDGPADLARARLETPAGGLSSPRVLGDARQLIFFATHGNSPHWANGIYARLLASWQAASVALLHLLPRQRWAHSLLGEPQGLAHSFQPGCANSALDIEPFWWRSAPDPGESRVVRLPAVPIEPVALDGWARMQMALGRQAEVFLLDPCDAMTPEEAALLAPAETEAELALANLRERSPRAHDLAIMLASAPFTLPVARLVQEVTQESAADFTVLAELMMSGLVIPRSGDADAARETTYFTIRDEARPLLLRAQRSADAEALADSLDARISKHLSAIEARDVRFAALIATPEGQERLPAWAKPFAHLTMALREGGRAAPAARDWWQIMEVLNAMIVGGLARLAASDRPLGPETVRADLWPYADNPRFLEPSETGELKFRPEVAGYLRERLAGAPYLGLRLYWVGEASKKSEDIVYDLVVRGADEVMVAQTTQEALAKPALGTYDIFISDMTRGDNRRAGYDLIQVLRERDIPAPVIIFDEGMGSKKRRREAMVAGAFGGTDSANELLLLIDAAAHEIVFQPEPKPLPVAADPAEESGQHDPLLRELTDIPEGEFCTLQEITRHLLVSEVINREGDIVDSLLIFHTKRQKTWILATEISFIFVLDDPDTRKERRLMRRLVPLFQVEPVVASIGPSGSAVVQFGDDQAPWYYSQSLYRSTRGIERAIRGLLGKAMFGRDKPPGRAPASRDRRSSRSARLLLDQYGPIFNRHRLREFIGFSARGYGDRLWFVDGPPGSGRSATGWITRRFVEERVPDGVRIIELDANRRENIDQIMKDLLDQLDVPRHWLPKMEGSTAETRWRRYANMIEDQLRYQNQDHLLVVNADHTSAQLMHELVETLADVARSGRHRIIFVGQMPKLVERRHPNVYLEYLENFTPEEIFEGLALFMKQHDLKGDPNSLAHRIIEYAEGAERYNAAVSRFAREELELLRDGGPRG